MAQTPSIKDRWLAVLERFVPLLLSLAVPVGGAIWAVYVYTQNHAEVAAKQALERSAQLRNQLIELQKPFIDEQFNTYNLFVKAIGDILIAKPYKEDWSSVWNRYWLVHWSVMSLVEDQEVHDAKLRFGNSLVGYATAAAGFQELEVKQSEEVKELSDNVDMTAAEKNNEHTRIKEKYVKLIGDAGEKFRKTRQELETNSIALTTAMRLSIQKSWSGQLGTDIR